jgi:Protein of unknown function (DUF5661)
MKKRQKGKTTPLKVPCDAGHRSAGWTEEDFDERVLHRGAKIEFEHTRNPEVAERIAMDHLVEGKNYYELLEEMEKKLIPYKKLVPKPQVFDKCKIKPLIKQKRDPLENPHNYAVGKKAFGNPTKKLSQFDQIKN